MNDEILMLAQYQLGYIDKLPIYMTEKYQLKLVGDRYHVDVIKFPKVIPDSELTDFIKEFRAMFAKYPNLKGNKGSEAKIRERLIWFINETGLSLEEIRSATEYYITECLKIGRYLLDPHYFIWKADVSNKKSLDDSRLFQAHLDRLEDTEDFKTTYEIQ